MPYLTRVALDPSHRDVFRALGDSHALHRLVYLGFPDSEDGGAGRPLYRLDPPPPPRRDRPVLIIQSAQPPAHLERWIDRPYLSVEGPKQFNVDGLRPGQLFQFRLRANPTKRFVNKTRRDEAGNIVGVVPLSRERQSTSGTMRREGKRLGLYSEAEQLEWLEAKAFRAGFEVLRVKIAPARTSGPTDMPDVALRPGRPEGTARGWHCDRSRENQAPRCIEHLSVTFEGLLTVTSPEALRTAVEQGIGSAKGFGFGLLSLAPVR